MITKTANRVLYDDPADEMVLHYINSGEARDYGIGAKPVAQMVGGLTGMGAGVGLGARHTLSGAARGGAAGLGLGLGLAGLGQYVHLRRKRQASNTLNTGDNRALLNERLRRLQGDGVDVKNPNSLNRYLSGRVNR